MIDLQSLADLAVGPRPRNALITHYFTHYCAHKKERVEVEKPKVDIVRKPAAQPKMPALPKPGPMPKPAVKPKETESGDADANAGLVGVAFGGAPLLFAPLVALSAGRVEDCCTQRTDPKRNCRG
jgi:hypothetical protein